MLENTVNKKRIEKENPNKHGSNKFLKKIRISKTQKIVFVKLFFSSWEKDIDISRCGPMEKTYPGLRVYSLFSRCKSGLIV